MAKLERIWAVDRTHFKKTIEMNQEDFVDSK